MKKWLIAVLALSCALALAACAGSPTPTPMPTATNTPLPTATPTRITVNTGSPAAANVLTAADDSKTVQVQVGQAIVITLDSNATTGYRWRLGQPLDEAVVRLEGSEYLAPTPVPGLVGAGGREVWRFTAIGRGQTALAMQYVRPFETTPTPARTFSVTLVVVVEG